MGVLESSDVAAAILAFFAGAISLLLRLSAVAGLFYSDGILSP